MCVGKGGRHNSALHVDEAAASQIQRMHVAWNDKEIAGSCCWHTQKEASQNTTTPVCVAATAALDDAIKVVALKQQRISSAKRCLLKANKLCAHHSVLQAKQQQTPSSPAA